MSFFSVKQHPVRSFAITASLIILFILFIEIINDRFWLSDFKVMYSAAQAWLNGEKVYGVSFGLISGLYKYSPFTLLLFAPYTVLPYGIACVIHFLITGASAILSIVILQGMVSKNLGLMVKRTYLVLIAMLLLVGNHLFRELHLGNVNMILLLLLTLALKFTLDKKPKLSGLLLAVVILTKPYFIICLLPMFFHKRYKTIFASAIAGVGLVLLSLLIFGFADGFELYQEWIEAMLAHSTYLVSTHTIYALLEQYTGIVSNPNYLLVLLGLALAISLFFWRKLMSNPKSSEDEKSLIIHYFLLVGLIPTMLITDTEHFLFALPLIAIFLPQLNRKPKYLWIGLFVLFVLCYAANSPDLLGKKLSALHEEWGLLGIGNIVLLLAVSVFFFRNRFCTNG